MNSERGKKKQRATALRSQIAALRTRAKGAPSEASPPSRAVPAESPREFTERRAAELDEQRRGAKKER